MKSDLCWCSSAWQMYKHRDGDYYLYPNGQWSLYCGQEAVIQESHFLFEGRCMVYVTSSLWEFEESKRIVDYIQPFLISHYFWNPDVRPLYTTQVSGELWIWYLHKTEFSSHCIPGILSWIFIRWHLNPYKQMNDMIKSMKETAKSLIFLCSPFCLFYFLMSLFFLLQCQNRNVTCSLPQQGWFECWRHFLYRDHLLDCVLQIMKCFFYLLSGAMHVVMHAGIGSCAHPITTGPHNHFLWCWTPASGFKRMVFKHFLIPR